ncbi:hypothetical protein ACFQL1_06085 [Halomicroarcula sp. GCM10025709]|uniref:DUF7845 domain-containing protein n=1 Tax=Haloarcula TaxID=2237 RepID=UPI0024C43BA0|nr:hypothetical protein [Halomicroarcula sp. YJ-61-S]
MTVASTIEDVVALRPHRVAANLLFDDAGLSPYHAVVGQYEPDLDEREETFGFDGREWGITNSVHWEGKIESDDAYFGFDGALNEYKLSVYADDDEHDERGADFTFRPGFPEAKHVETGDMIQGMPTQCPESIRVQVEATNLEQREILGLLQSLAEHLGINAEYFATPHEWSSIYGLEVYGRIRRAVATGKVAGKGGVLEHIAQFSNGRGRGAYKWDHEEIVGHYEAVSLSPANWARLIDGQGLAKRLKCYQPEWVRSDGEDDPLYHHKIECQYWKGYYPDGDDSLRWDGYDSAVQELGETIVNALNWAGVEFSPTTETWVADPYFDVEQGERSYEVHSNPMPDLEEQEQASARDQLMRPETTAAEWDMLEAMTDGGSRRYDELADDAGRSTSTVYRAVEQFDDILAVDGGEIRFRDGIVRDQIEQVAEWFGSTKDAAVESLRNVADRATPLSRGEEGEPSALERWVNRHGIAVRDATDGIEMELSRPVSLQEMLKIVRAGPDAAEASPMLTRRFEDAQITWKEPDSTRHKGERVVVNRRLLGRHNMDRPIW